MKLLTALLFFLSLCIFSFGMQSEEDSLLTLLKSSGEDTAKVNLLNVIGKFYWTSLPDKVIKYGNEAKELAQKIGFKRGLGYAYKNIGRGYFNQGNYLEALQNYETSLAVLDSIGDKKGVANMQSNIGNVYSNKGAETKALEYYFSSLKISEELKDTLRMITTLNNIGVVYQNKKQTYNLALEYFLKATPLADAIQDNNSIGTITCNIGEIYLLKIEELLEKNTNQNLIKTFSDSALYFFNKSLSAYEGMEDAAYTFNDIGKLFRTEKKYDEAISNHKQAYAIAKKYDARNDMAISQLGLAQTYLDKGDSKSALTSFKDAEQLADKTESQYTLKDIYDGLSKVYGNLSDFRNAFKYQNLLIAAKDDIYNIEQDKKLGKIAFEYDLDKKKGEIDLLTKDQELKAKEISRQKMVRNSFILGFAVVLLFAGVFLSQRNKIGKEKKRSEDLLLNILPAEVAEELKTKGSAEARLIDNVTVLFTDFKGFTAMSEKLTPKQLVKDIHECFSGFDKIAEKYGIEKIKTIGDSYMAAGGLPTPNNTHAEDAIKAAFEMREFIAVGKARKIAIGAPYFEIRIGIHTGPVVAGIVGVKKFAYDIWGDTVNTASRLESSGEPGKINISETTYALVKDKFKCEHRGKINAKNKGEIDMYFVESLS